MEEPWDALEKFPPNSGGQSIQEALALARTLADRLAHAHPHPPDDDGYLLRLAHALTLDIVDLLEDARGP